MAIQGGYLLPGATLLRGEDTGFFETYKGVVETETGKSSAYVKLLPPKALANELVCTVLGQAAGLPMPHGYLVQVSLEDYPESAFLTGQNLSHTLAYGSGDLNSPSLARQFGAENTHAAFRKLIPRWPRWRDALLFDEWVSNADRHPGNFLVRGPEDVWLIDHSHAFRGPSWYFTDLVPHAITKNLLAQHAQSILTLPERNQLIEEAERIAAALATLSVKELMDESLALNLLTEEEAKAVQEFLVTRVKSLTGLVAKHVGIPRFPAMEEV